MRGLSAKPIIDIDVVIKDYSVFDAVVAALKEIGYHHEGDLGKKKRRLSTPHLYITIPVCRDLYLVNTTCCERDRT